MALTILKAPQFLAPVRDPVWLELQATGYQVTPPVYAVFTIAFVQDPEEDMFFKLVFGGYSLTFTFVDATPDESGLQVRIGADIAATTTNLATALQLNHAVFTTFHVTQDGYTITLTARQPGLLEMGFSNTSPVTISFITVTTGVDAEYAPSYAAYHQLWVEQEWGTGIYTPLPANFGRPDPQFRIRWDISSQLKPYLQYQWPAVRQNTAMVLRGLQRKYQIARWEAFGEPPEAKRLATTGPYRALLAGSAHNEHIWFSGFITKMRDSASLNPFMTYRGRGGRHEVTADQEHYIAWLRRPVKVAEQNVYVTFTVYYTDGTSQTANKHTDADASGWEQDDVKLFPSGFNVMGLHLLDTTRIPAYYTMVVVSHTNTPLSETHTWHLVDPDANQLYIEFVSSFGVVESMRATGAWTINTTTDHTQVRRSLVVTGGVVPSVELSRSVQHPNGATRTIKLHTGLMDLQEFNALLDVLHSPEHRLAGRGAYRHPLVLIGAEHITRSMGTETEHLHGMELEFQMGDAEMAWSNLLVLSTDPEDPVFGDWNGDDDDVEEDT